MDGQKTPKRTLGAAALGVAAVALCCGAPVLIVAGGAVVAALGWAVLGVGGTVAALSLPLGREEGMHCRGYLHRLDSTKGVSHGQEPDAKDTATG